MFYYKKKTKMNTTIIFNELDRHKTARYKVKGCEKAVIVRSDTTTAFNLDISTMSLEDPHYRTNPFMSIVQAGDYSIINTPIGCGMELIFQVDDSIDPLAHLFVEIIYDTCVPEKCCGCK
jgi:hypothetical protein